MGKTKENRSKALSKHGTGGGEKTVDYTEQPRQHSGEGQVSKRQKLLNLPEEEFFQVSGLDDLTHTTSGDNIIVDNSLSTNNNTSGDNLVHTPLSTSTTSADVDDDDDDVPLSTLAVQISFEPPAAGERIEDLRIKETAIVGRPSRLFGSSMGDHTTAFSVHRRSIENALKGMSLRLAAEYIVGDNGLLAKSQLLPGAQEAILNASGRKEEIEWYQANIRSLGEDLKTAVDNDGLGAPLILQRLIGSYLEYRELIPLSALNIAAKSQGLAGKGKGEAKYVDLLVGYESDLFKYPPTTLEQAILATLDFTGLAATAIENNKALRSTMAPGITEDLTCDQVLELVITQHLQAIEACFPKAYKASGLDNSKEGRPSLLARFKHSIYKLTSDEVTHWLKQETGTRDKVEAAKNNADLLKPKVYRTGGSKGEPKPQYETARINALKAEEEYEAAALALNAYLQLLTGLVQNGIPETPATTSIQIEHSREDSPMGHAVELELGNDCKISGLRFAGRTPSPFSGTMGAHTTAWVVHLDAMDATLRGKTLAEAVAALDAKMVKLRKKAAEMARLQKKDTAPEKLALADTEAEAFKGMSVDTPDAGARLQKYVGAVLTYINFIPGSTINKIDTGGKAEGKYRNVLLEYERNGASVESMLDDNNEGEQLPGINAPKAYQVQRALHSLLDIARVSPAIRGRITMYHNKELKVAYPKAYALDQKLKRIAEKRKENEKKRPRNDAVPGTDGDSPSDQITE